MRFSLVFLASAATATVLPRGFGNAPVVPKKSLQTFQVVTLDEAKAGKDRALMGLPGGAANISTSRHGSHHKPRAILPDSSYPHEEKRDLMTRDAASCASNPNIRFEWQDYSASDRLAFVQAVKCLMNAPASGAFPPATSRYEDLVRIHQLYMPNVHNNAKFTVWHRYFLWTFEQLLRDECGFDRAMVWWDETKNAGAFAQSDMFTNSLYFGSLPTPDSNGNGICINNGEFSGLTANIGPGTSDTSHCVSRGVTESDTAQCSTDYINYCNERTDYSDFESCLEYGPHGYGHNGIGGTMSDVWGSPSDPIFWMHHSFVDHSWRIWENQDSARIQSIDGVDVNGNELTLNTMVYMGGIRPDVPISAIINTLGGVLIGGVPFCYRYNY